MERLAQPPSADAAKADASVQPFIDFVVRDRPAPSPPRAQVRRTTPYDYVWHGITPPNAPVQWYGPDASTGTFGAKLISQAAGDRYAGSSVGIAWYSSSDVDVRVFNTVTARFFCDAGGVGLCAAASRGAIQISVFEEGAASPIVRASKVLFMKEAYMPLPGVPVYDWAEEGWNQHVNTVVFPARAGKWYSIWSEADQYVRTTGACGAQSDLAVIANEIRPVPRGS